jgi:hypothetical protein
MRSKANQWWLAGVLAGMGLVGATACDGREAYEDEMRGMSRDQSKLREAYQEESSELRREQQHIEREVRIEGPTSDDSIDETRQEAIMNGATQD